MPSGAVTTWSQVELPGALDGPRSVMQPFQVGWLAALQLLPPCEPQPPPQPRPPPQPPQPLPPLQLWLSEFQSVQSIQLPL